MMRDSIYINGQMPSPERQKELLTKIADQIDCDTAYVERE